MNRNSNHTQKEIVAIIVNWQRPQDTISCINSLLATNYQSLKILVVDNGSDDDSIIQISKAFPFIEILSLPQNLGFAGGYNAGIEYALKSDATHFFILNNDTVVDVDAIHHLLNSSYDIAIPKILYYSNPERIWAAGARWRSFPPSVIMNGLGHLDDGSYDRPMSLNYATGCALLTHRSVWEQVGGFDTDFISYMEDYDFCFRARAAEFTIGYEPKAVIYHKVSLTLGEWSSKKVWFLGRNSVLFYRKGERFSRWQLWSFIMWVILRSILIGRTNVIRPFWKGVRAGRDFLYEEGIQ